MEFGVLGPLVVAGPEGPVEVRGAKRRALVALFIVRNGTLTPVERLVEELWGEDAPTLRRRDADGDGPRAEQLLADATAVADELGLDRITRAVARVRELG